MNNKKKILKIIFTILSVALFVGLIIYLFPTMKGITTPEGRLKFQQKLDGMGMGIKKIVPVTVIMLHETIF